MGDCHVSEMSLFDELKRRKVFRVAGGYVVVSWVLVQVADIMLNNFGAPDWVFKSLVAVLFIGFPLAVFLTWAYELTPDGVRRSAQAESVAAGPPQTRRHFAALAALGIVVIATGFVVERWWLSGRNADALPSQTTAIASHDSASRRSIAVLPFADMSQSGDQEYFADGIAEEILNLLARLPDLKVAGRTSAFQFKNQHQDLRRIGETLSVENILEGSVRKSGMRIRISAQLVNADDGFHLWSETYDRDFTDIFEIQDDIARAISDALSAELLGAVAHRKRPTNDLEAYRIYLQGRHLVLQRGAENMNAAIRHLERAVEMDPEFAEAWAELALALALLPTYAPSLNRRPLADRSLEASQRALALAPDLPMARVALGFVHLHDFRWTESFAELDRAIALDPENEAAWLYRSFALSGTRYDDRALEAVERAYAIAPTTGINSGWLGLMHLLRGDTVLAERFIDESVAMGWVYAHSLKGALQLHNGEHDAARHSFRQYLTRVGEPADGLDPFLDARLDPSLRQPALDALAQRGHAQHTMFGAALLIGDGELMVRYLENHSNNATSELTWAQQPVFRAVFDQPPVKAYLRRIGLLDYWREHGWPETCRPLGDDDFECA
jgi:adenylate cyclase